MLASIFQPYKGMSGERSTDTWISDSSKTISTALRALVPLYAYTSPASLPFTQSQV